MTHIKSGRRAGEVMTSNGDKDGRFRCGRSASRQQACGQNAIAQPPLEQFVTDVALRWLDKQKVLAGVARQAARG